MRIFKHFIQEDNFRAAGASYAFLIMIFVLDGSSEPGTHVWSKTGDLGCLRHLFKINSIVKFEIFVQFTRAQHFLSYHHIYVL